jgi:sigma-B regulation protein RsbU (phosphoserine phosphatase)
MEQQPSPATQAGPLPSPAGVAALPQAPKVRVALSVGTKLLISIVALLALVILFLSLSTVFLLKEDKRAYVYQSQSTAALLTGREIVNTARHALDTARVALGSFDPHAANHETAALKSIIQNQTELLHLGIFLVDATGAAKVTVTAQREEGEKLTPEQLTIAPEWWKTALPELLKSGYAYTNLTSVEGPPLLGVLAADLKLKDNPAGMPVALAVVSLLGFGQELRGLDLTIATRTGWVLYDTVSSRLLAKVNISDDPLFDLAAKSTTRSGASEYDHNGEHLLGSYVNPGLDLTVLARTEWRRAIRSTYTLTEKFIFLGLMAIGAAIVFAIFFSKTLTAPINKLYKATFDVAKGNFDLKLEAKSHDEIGALTESFNDMSKQISGLIADKMEKVHIEQELAIASTVQQTLIPPPTYTDPNLLIHSHYQAASTCGGDWWGFFKVGNRACLMIADATGHGFPSALITASARSCFSVMHKLAQERGQLAIAPVTMLHYANRVIYEASAAKIMMTMFVGVIDFDTRSITYANAGHNPPWLFRRGEGDKYKLNSLVALGHRLGEKLESAEFEQKVVQFGDRDLLFLYTDGLMEGSSPDGEMFGKKRARRIVEQNLVAGPKAMIDGLVKDFMGYNGEKPLDDDVTLAAALLIPEAGQANGPTG